MRDLSFDHSWLSLLMSLHISRGALRLAPTNVPDLGLKGLIWPGQIRSGPISMAPQVPGGHSQGLQPAD